MVAVVVDYTMASTILVAILFAYVETRLVIVAPTRVATRFNFTSMAFTLTTKRGHRYYTNVKPTSFAPRFRDAQGDVTKPSRAEVTAQFGVIEFDCLALTLLYGFFTLVSR